MPEDMIIWVEENINLIHILRIHHGCSIIEEIIGLNDQGQEAQEVEKERKENMDGGMEFQAQKVEGLREGDMIQVSPQGLVLGVRNNQKSITEMIGNKHMVVNLELGMMLYLKMLLKSLNFFSLIKLQIWLIK